MNYARFLLNGTVLGLALTLVAATPGFAEKTTPPAAATAASIDFGDDTSEWAKDGECDDPRFTGQGAASELVAADIKKDATDCKAAFDAGTVTLKDGAPTTPATTNTPAVATTGAAVDFGDDTSEWSKDGECDDPRFTGTGVSSDPSAVDIKKDATDCEAAVKAGTATAKDGAAPTATTDTPATPATTDTPASTAAVDFGD
ncbi:hypothetical protein, partial [Devosia sp.]|uniref:hypothetical protein n=1 Tax=Devosia sp. TaxID=1871048 RepID=UPI0032636DE6